MLSEVLPAIGRVLPLIGSVVSAIGRIVPTIGSVLPAFGRIVRIIGKVLPVIERVVPAISEVLPIIASILLNANSFSGTTSFELFFDLRNGEVLAAFLHIADVLWETAHLIGHILLGFLIADALLLKVIVKLFSHV